MSAIFTLRNPRRRTIGNAIWPPAIVAYFLLKWLSPSTDKRWGYALIAIAYLGIALKLSSGRWHWPGKPN